MKKKSGFTLVEILVVIVIIGIMATVAIPKLMSYQGRARDSQRKFDIRNIAASLVLYKNDVGEYPSIKDVIPNFARQNRSYSYSNPGYYSYNYNYNYYSNYRTPQGSTQQYYSSMGNYTYNYSYGSYSYNYNYVWSQTYLMPNREPVSASSFQLYGSLLKKYMTNIPKEPKTPDISRGTLGISFDAGPTDSVFDGYYAYTPLKRGGKADAGFAIMSSVEDEASANRLVGGVNVALANAQSSNGFQTEFPYPTDGTSESRQRYRDEYNKDTYYIGSIYPELSVTDIASNLCSKIEKINWTNNQRSWVQGGGNVLLGGKNNGTCYVNTYPLYNDALGFGRPYLNRNYYFQEGDLYNLQIITDPKKIEQAHYKYVYVQAND